VADVASRARDLPLIDATLVLLAGGRSSRMGRSKADLPVAGTTLLAWLVERWRPGFTETLVCGASAPPGARTVADRRSDAGPLAGIEAGLEAMRGDVALVLACDMPRVTVRLLRLLVERSISRDAAAPRIAGRAQPTCAAYRRSALPKIRAYLDRGERRATEGLASLDVLYVDEAGLADAGVPLSALDDLDTPADYDAFVASLRT
jgi:molybdopterin-guanine dinucleotide biosynthesis protein A